MHNKNSLVAFFTKLTLQSFSEPMNFILYASIYVNNSKLKKEKLPVFRVGLLRSFSHVTQKSRSLY